MVNVNIKAGRNPLEKFCDFLVRNYYDYIHYMYFFSKVRNNSDMLEE